MRHLKMLGLAAFVAMAFTAFVGANSASATTLEKTKVTQNGSVTMTGSKKPGTSEVLRDTFGFFANTCASTHLHAELTSFTPKPTGPVSELSFSNCDHTVTVHKPGKLYFEWTSGTKGRIFSEETEVTMYSTIHGTHVNCTTGAGTPIGTLTGVESGQAEIDINATLTCGPHLHSAKWTGTWIVTSPHGLGISP